MALDFSFANVVSTVALLISSGSLYVTWANRKDAARANQPRLWLTTEKFEGDHDEWRWVYVHLDNRSANWVRLVSVQARRGTRLHSFAGALIGGNDWQFPDNVTDDGLCDELDLTGQEAAAGPGDATHAQFLVRANGRKIRLKVSLRIALERPRTRTLKLEALI